MNAIDKIADCSENDTCGMGNDLLDARLGRANCLQNDPQDIKLTTQWGGSRPGAGRPAGSLNKPKPRIIQSAGPRWFVVETWRGREKRVVRDLLEGEDREGCIYRPPYQVYYPTCAVEITSRNLRRTVHQSLYLGYVFVAFDADRDYWAPICHVPDILRLHMTSLLKPIPLPVGFVERLVDDAPERLKLPSVRMTPFAHGQRLQVLKGAFQGQTVVCDACDGLTTRALISAFGGRDIATLFPRADLNAIEG